MRELDLYTWKFQAITLCGLLAFAKFAHGQVDSREQASRSNHLASPQSNGTAGFSQKPVLRVNGNKFLDQNDRVITLRGVNISGGAKVPPFTIVNSHADLDRLPSFGFNVIRLVTIWEALEPTAGLFNEQYLAGMQSLVDAAWARGLFVIIDIHQDGFSRFTARGAGDGFPAWAVSRRAKPSVPNNGPASKNWPLLMSTDPAVYRSFADFYSNENGVRTSYLRMLDRISSQFRGCPGVIGYDLLNEPWGRESDEIGPLYRDAAVAIRAQHPSAILFVEGHLTTNTGVQTKLERPEFSNFAYAPHFYDPFVITRKAWNGTPHLIDRAFQHMQGKADEWNVPLFVGEFGAPATAAGVDRYIDTVYDHLDADLASGAQWNFSTTWNDRDKDGWNLEDFNIFEPTGQPRPNFEPRPYPRATAGTPHDYRFQKADKSSPINQLKFAWEHDPSRGATELYLPDELFPPNRTTYQVNVADVTLSRDGASQILSCVSPVKQMVFLELKTVAPE